MKKIRIAQIGINRYSHAPEIFTTLKSLPELFDVAGYALVEDERETCSNKMWCFEGYPELTLDEILNDPTIEAVTIETDEIHITKYAQMAAEHGKHIHMEKPGSQSLEGFEKLIETVKKNGKTFHIGYMYRYNPYISDAIKRAQNGDFGEVFSVEAQMSRMDSETTRKWFGSFKGGHMFYLGCHLIDLVLQLQGEPDNIIPLNCSIDPENIGTEDYAMAVMQYPHGVSFVKIATEVAGFIRRQLVISGTKGTVEIKPLEIGVKREEGMVPYPNRAQRRVSLSDGDRNIETSEVFGRYDAMIRAFAEMVRGEKTNPYTCDYELTLFKTILKCCGVDE